MKPEETLEKIHSPDLTPDKTSPFSPDSYRDGEGPGMMAVSPFSACGEGPGMRYKSSNIDIIQAYIEAGGEGIVLTDLQQKILDRLRFADEKIRQGHGKFKREEIAGMIKVTFGVSRDTAYKDIVNAEHVFSSSFPLNKRYEIGGRIEFMKEKIRFAAADNDWDAVARLEKVLVEYYKQYPDIRQTDMKKNIIMNVLQQFFTMPADTMNVEDAIQIAEAIDEEEDNE